MRGTDDRAGAASMARYIAWRGAVGDIAARYSREQELRAARALRRRRIQAVIYGIRRQCCGSEAHRAGRRVALSHGDGAAGSYTQGATARGRLRKARNYLYKSLQRYSSFVGSLLSFV